MNCAICLKPNENPILYGEIMEKSNIRVHYYCLLLSTNLVQSARDTSGILGFEIRDIKSFIKTISKKTCIYCNNTNASIKCGTKNCNRQFHLVCGLSKLCSFQYVDEFKSYCDSHVPITHPIKHNDIRTCEICFSTMGPYHPITSVMARCCNDGWVHRTCLMKYALSAGYYLKCLFCRSPDFRNQIRIEGIFVPDRDASWELEKHAFRNLHEGYKRCDAEKCLCPQGKTFICNYRNKKGKWRLLVCNTCGACGIHNECLKSSNQNEEVNIFTCEQCKIIYEHNKKRIFDLSQINHSNAVALSQQMSKILPNINSNILTSNHELLDQSLYMVKSCPTFNQLTNCVEEINPLEVIAENDCSSSKSENEEFFKVLCIPSDNPVGRIKGLAKVRVKSGVDPNKKSFGADEVDCYEVGLYSSDEDDEDDGNLTLEDLGLNKDLLEKLYAEFIAQETKEDAEFEAKRKEEEEDKKNKICRSEEINLDEENSIDSNTSASALLNEMTNKKYVQMPKPLKK